MSLCAQDNFGSCLLPEPSYGVLFHSQKCPALDDKVYGHPKYNKWILWCESWKAEAAIIAWLVQEWPRSPRKQEHIQLHTPRISGSVTGGTCRVAPWQSRLCLKLGKRDSTLNTESHKSGNQEMLPDRESRVGVISLYTVEDLHTKQGRNFFLCWPKINAKFCSM